MWNSLSVFAKNTKARKINILITVVLIVLGASCVSLNNSAEQSLIDAEEILKIEEQYQQFVDMINDSQWYDMIIEKNGLFKTIQVKYTSQLDKNGKYYKCSLRSISGTSRKPIYSVTDTPVDYLFCC